MQNAQTGRLLGRAASLAGLMGLLCGLEVLAEDYAWDVGNTGGNWSTTTNWNPEGVPGGGGDSAMLGNVSTGTRTVVYDGATSGTVVSTLSFEQTSAAVNELRVEKTLSITSAVTLAASPGGTVRMFLDPAAGGTNFATTYTGGITIDSGGELRLRSVNLAGGASNINSDVSGNVTVAGGSLVVAPLLKNGTNTGASQNQIVGALTMLSGSILIDNVDATGERDRRLRVTGNVNITGGTIGATANSANLVFTGGSLNFSPATFDASKFMIQLDGSNQSFSSGVAVGDMTLRGTGTKTISNSAAGQNIGHIQIADGAATSAGTIFKLGSNLTLNSGRPMPSAAGVGQSPEGGRIDLGVDADVYALDLTSNAGRWTPNLAASGVTSALWTVSGNGGRIVANGYDFTGTGITVNVGAGLTLESKAGNSVANNLGSGTIASTSTFLYSGTAAIGTPSTLTATATIGNVAVSSGALRLATLSGGIAGAATVSGGSLDLGSTTRIFTNVTLTGGEITAGTASTAGQMSLQAGTISASVTGAGGFVKQGPGTVTLVGANSFTGNGFVQGGTLIVANDSALGGTSGTTRVDGGSTGAVLGFSGGITTAEPIRLLMQGAGAAFSGLRNLTGDNRLTGPISLDSGGATWEIASDAGTLFLDGDITSVISATDSWRTMGFGGPASGVVNGNIADSPTSKVNVTVRGGTWTITSDATFTGQTRVDAGTLVVSGSLTGTSGVAVGTGTRLAGSGTINAALSGAGLVSPGNSPGILTATQVDPTGGLAHAFEFTATGSPDYADATASINDVLRLTSATTPFASSLSSGNAVDVYFDVASLAVGDTFRGGFYTDLAADFLSSIADGSFAYWVRGGSERTFNGQGYSSLAAFDPTLSVTLSTVAEAANFGGGTVDGQVTQFAIVPEPGTLALGGLAAAGALLVARRRLRAA